MSIPRITALFAVLSAGALAVACAAPYTARPDRQVVVDQSCADADFPIYFADQSADLTAPALKVIADNGRLAVRCTALSVEVVGLADYRGAAEPNLELSRRRAEQVAHALEHAGLPSPVFHLVAAGEAGAVGPAGDPEPMRRRAEVFIRYKH